MGRVISGFLDLKCKIDFHSKPKDLISYTSLVKAIEDYRNYGDPYFRDKNDSKMKNSLKTFLKSFFKLEASFYLFILYWKVFQDEIK